MLKLGNRVIITGRRQSLLDEVVRVNPGMHSVALDVTDPVAVAVFRDEIETHFPKLDTLITNAGISRTESWNDETVEIADALSSIDANITGVVRVTAALLPILRRQPVATLIATTSGLAFVPRVHNPTYCASKAFLHSWLQSLRHQLRRGPVEVLELAPPYVQTELAGCQQASDPAAMSLSAVSRRS